MVIARLLKITFVLFVCLPIISFAQTGKIVGNVTDLETGEALIGANIILEGTLLGAATDISGDFLLLNVPPGTYTLVGKFIGYRSQTISNIQISVNLTTEAVFSLSPESYETEQVTVIAPKPLINKNVTNSTSIMRAEDMENLPIRGVNAVVGTQGGIVTQDGDIFVRGSRSDAVAFYIDGVLVNNPVFGGSQTSMIQNAIQEIQVQTGGYSAEFGGANGGIISTQSKSGSSKYRITAEAITDNFNSVGKEFLGGYTYGHSELVLTAGGPILPSLKFFVAGNNVYQRSRAEFTREFKFLDLFDPQLANPDTFNINIPKGSMPNDGSNQYQIQGNITWDASPITFKLSSNYRTREYYDGVVDDLLDFDWTRINTKNSTGFNEEYTLTTSFKATHVFNNKAFYDVILNYFDDYYVNMDPIFKHNIPLYGDSVANAQVGRELLSDGQFTSDLSAFGINFDRNERPWDGYRKQRTKSIGGKINLLYQIGKNHEFKAGVDYQYYTVRRYSLPSPIGIAQSYKAIADGDPRGIYDRLDNYGYDIYGNVSDAANEGPKHPVFAAGYIQDKMEFEDLVLNLGARLDYISTDTETFKDPSNVQFDADGIIDPASMVKVDPLLQVSPRIGFSFPVTDKTVFHAQYGKFIQQSRLRDVYLGFNRASDVIKGGFAESQPVGYGIRPERTTAYEIGFSQQLGESFAFDITGFYKDIKDQVQLRPIFANENAAHTRYYAFINGDFGTVKGIEFKLDLRRTERLSANFDYTYSDAKGTGSTPNTAFRTVWQSPTNTPYFPQIISPTTFNQSHKGSLNLDYRFSDDDGPELFGSKFLSKFGGNLLFTFTSGFNYTRWDGFDNARTPNETLNESSTPWTFQLDARIDKSFSIGPLNLNVYLWVINVLNTQNVIDVFNTTGDAFDDGFLATDAGKTSYNGIKNAYGEDAANTFKELYLADIYDPAFFGPPRQIRLGIKLEY